MAETVEITSTRAIEVAKEAQFNLTVCEDTAHIFASSENVRLTLLERSVLEAYALGNSEKQIAEDNGIPVRAIKRIIYNPENAKFISDLVLSYDSLQKAKSVAVLSKIIDEKMNSVDNAAELTKKDVVDLIMARDSILKEREKKSLGTAENTTYVNILQQLVGG